MDPTGTLDRENAAAGAAHFSKSNKATPMTYKFDNLAYEIYFENNSYSQMRLRFYYSKNFWIFLNRKYSYNSIKHKIFIQDIYIFQNQSNHIIKKIISKKVDSRLFVGHIKFHPDKIAGFLQSSEKLRSSVEIVEEKYFRFTYEHFCEKSDVEAENIYDFENENLTSRIGLPGGELVKSRKSKSLPQLSRQKSNKKSEKRGNFTVAPKPKNSAKSPAKPKRIFKSPKKLPRKSPKKPAKSPKKFGSVSSFLSRDLKSKQNKISKQNTLDLKNSLPNYEEIELNLDEISTEEVSDTEFCKSQG